MVLAGHGLRRIPGLPAREPRTAVRPRHRSRARRHLRTCAGRQDHVGALVAGRPSCGTRGGLGAAARRQGCWTIVDAGARPVPVVRPGQLGPQHRHGALQAISDEHLASVMQAAREAIESELPSGSATDRASTTYGFVRCTSCTGRQPSSGGRVIRSRWQSDAGEDHVRTQFGDEVVPERHTSRHEVARTGVAAGTTSASWGPRSAGRRAGRCWGRGPRSSPGDRAGRRATRRTTHGADSWWK